MSASLMPSDRWSCSGSLLLFLNGSTAIDVIAALAVAYRVDTA